MNHAGFTDETVDHNSIREPWFELMMIVGKRVVVAYCGAYRNIGECGIGGHGRQGRL